MSRVAMSIYLVLMTLAGPQVCPCSARRLSSRLTAPGAEQLASPPQILDGGADGPFLNPKDLLRAFHFLRC